MRVEDCVDRFGEARPRLKAEIPFRFARADVRKGGSGRERICDFKGGEAAPQLPE